MTRFLSVLLLLVCCAGPLAMQPPRKAEPPPAPAPAPAPPAGLTVDGKYTLVVTEMPFKVLAPAGADLYFWRVPPGWAVTDNGDSLTVTAAPAGAAPVGLQTVTIDWTNHKTLKGNYSLSVAVGGTPPPQPPGPGPQPPGPGPLDSFQKQLTAALAAEPDRSALPKVVAYYRAAALTAQSPQYATTAQLWAALTAQAASSGAAGALPGVRAVTQAEVARLWPGPIPADAPLTDAQRAGLRSIFERAAAALGGA
jgi:hypothetical protein